MTKKNGICNDPLDCAGCGTCAEPKGAKIIRKATDGFKCGGCNDFVYDMYGVEGTDFSIDEDGRPVEGLCGYCFLDMVVDEKWRVSTH